MQACRNANHAEAEDHIFDELKDWIGALPDWNGEKRCDGLLVTYAGADPQAHSAEYLALVGSKYIMQVLNRATSSTQNGRYARRRGVRRKSPEYNQSARRDGAVKHHRGGALTVGDLHRAQVAPLAF